MATIIKIVYNVTNPVIKVTYDVTNITVAGNDIAPVYISLDYSSSSAVTVITSVGLTMPAAFTVSNSPLTSSGTISVTGAGTTAQYVRGDGTLATFPALTGYVPYTGATTNVDLGEYELKAGQLTLDVSPTGTASVGTTRWNNTIGSSETTLKGGSVILKNGVDLVARVVNKVSPNATLTKAAYQAVRVSGAQGQRLAVAYAQANNDNGSADTIGLVTETIPTNQEGFIITVGQLEGINTTGSLQGENWTDGDVLYLSPTIAGAITNIKPVAPQHLVIIGYVEYAHANNGKIYVKVMNGWELGELHDVSTAGAVNGSVLKYNGTIWTPSSDTDTGITTLNGLTALSQSFAVGTTGTDFNIQSLTSTHTFNLPVASGSNTGKLSNVDWLTFDGKENVLTFSAPLSRSVNTVSIPVATTSQPGYLSSADWTTFDAKVTSVSATSPLFSSGGKTPTLTIQQASGSQNGYLSSTDWTTFNSKQPALSGTGFVKISGTTISYDNSTYYLASNPSAFIALTALSAGTGISYNNTTGVITNSAPDQVVSLTAGSGISISGTYPSFTIASTITQYTDALARLAISESVTGLDYNNTTGVFTLTSGYVIPTTSSATNWDAAYNDKINSAAVTGTTTKTLTLTQQDGGTITASWTDDNTDAVTSVFGRTGAVVATSGDYTTTLVTEGTNLYYTDVRVSANSDVAANTAARHNAVTIGTANGLSLSTQALSLGLSSSSTNGALSSSDWSTFNAKQNAITLTTTGSSGSATLVGATLNIPTYTVTGLGAVPDSRTITINGVVYDLSANRTFEVGDYGTF
jgi:hypothetical protein